MDEITKVYLDLVRFRHDEYVEPTKWKADLILNGTQSPKKFLDLVTSYLDQKIR